MHAVFYARYSSDRQSAASIANQVRLCRARSAGEGWSAGEVYRRKVANLEAALEDDELRADAAEALRALIEEIRLTPIGDSGALPVELYGELAALLALTDEHPRGASSRVRVSSIPRACLGLPDPGSLEMVAGAGFQRA